MKLTFLIIALYCTAAKTNLIINYVVRDSAKFSPRQTTTEPQVCFLGIRGDATFDKKDVKNARAIGSIMGTEMLPVLSFKMYVVNGLDKKGATSPDYNLTADQKSLLSTIHAGTKVIFTDVKVRLPDGKTRIIGPGTYTIK